MLAAILTAATVAQPLAFPGALGFGRLTVGGRYGEVCIITDTDDPGTTRACLEEDCNGPRFVVRQVGGSVQAIAPFHLCPDLTVNLVAGPGGFSILGWGVVISWGQVILRGWVGRLGDANWDPNNQATGQALLINQQARDVIVDMSTFAWYRDDFNIWSKPAGQHVDRITIQRSILAEPTGGKGVLIGVGDAGPAAISFVRNVVASSNSRHPTIGNLGNKVLTVDWSQNVIYNMGGGKSQVGSDLWRSAPIEILVSGNVYRRGPNVGYMSGSPAKVHLVATYNWPWQGFDLDGISLGHGGNTLDGWLVNAFESDANFSGEFDMAPIVVPYAMPAETGAETYANVLAEVAQRPLDALDMRIIEEVVLRTGSVKTSQPGPLPTFPFVAVSPDFDVDRDGMADAWELANGYDPMYDDHNADGDGDGRVALEDYLTEAANG